MGRKKISRRGRRADPAETTNPVIPPVTPVGPIEVDTTISERRYFLGEIPKIQIEFGLVAQLSLAPGQVTEGHHDIEWDEQIIVLRRRGVIFSAEVYEAETGVRLIRENVVSSSLDPSAARESNLWQDLAQRLLHSETIVGSGAVFSVFEKSDPTVVADFSGPFAAEGIHQETRIDLAGPAGSSKQM